MKISVLIVEDSYDDAFLMVRELKKATYDVTYLRVDTPEAFEDALKNQAWDVILSDYNLPQFTGEEALRIVKAHNIDIPFIVISGYIDEEAAVKMLKAGAHDYFSKNKMTLLVPAIEREMRDAQTRLQNSYAEQALVDSEQRYRSLIENLPQAILVFSNYEIVFANQSALQLFLVEDRHDLSGTYIRDQLTPIFTIDYASASNVRNVHHKREMKLEVDSETTYEVEVSAIPIKFQGQDALQVVIQDITAQKRAQQLLIQQQEFDRTTLDSLSAHIAILDKDTNIIATNLAWKNFGMQNGATQTLNGYHQNYLDVCERSYANGDESARYAAKLIRDVISGRRPSGQMETICRFEGEDRYFIMQVRPFKDIDHASLVISFEDVTAQKLAETELRSLYNATNSLFHGQNLNELSHHIVNAIVEEFDEVDCGLMLVNYSQEKILRLARAGQYPVDVTTTLFIDGGGLVPEVVRTGQTIYAPNVHLDERYLPNQSETCSELVIPLKSGERVIGVLDLQSPEVNAFGGDRQRILMIFAERAARAIEIMQLYDEINQYASQLENRVAKRTVELQHTTDRIQAILNNSSDIIIVANHDHAIRLVNPALQSVLGYTPEDIIGKQLSALISTSPDDMLDEILEQVIQESRNMRIQAQAHSIDGITVPVDVAMSVIQDEQGGTIEVICSIRDISRQKELEQELRISLEKEQELNQLKSSFVAMVSHEYRTPLATIQSSSELLEHYADDLTEDRKTHYLQKIRTQVSRMTELMEDILYISKAESDGIKLELEQVDILALTEEIIDDTKSTNGQHELQLTTHGELKHVVIDPKLMRLIINNLISNAVKYSPDGGDIHITIDGNIDELIISVQDSGIGIPQEGLSHLFERFHRASNVRNIKGTGLGLAIVKQAVDAHNGTIDVESEVNIGTKFIVTIPQ